VISIVPLEVTRQVEDAHAAMNQMLDQLHYTPSQSQVLLKPNIVDALKPNEAVTTDPFVVQGLILALQERGATSFVVGEASGFFASDEHWAVAVNEAGYVKMVDSLTKEFGIDVTLINLETAEREDYPWEYGTLPLPAICHTHAYINIAKMKTHAHTQVTLCCKNQKGLLRLAEKKKFHRGIQGANLHECIRALTAAIQPELAIIDATRALEGTGPTTEMNGQTKVRRLKLCIGGTDQVEVDNAGCLIMGTPVTEVAHLPEVPVEVAPGSLTLEDAIAKPPFRRPCIEVINGCFHRFAMETACTGCQVSLSRTFRKIQFVPELRALLGTFQESHSHVNLVLGKTPAEKIREIAANGGEFVFWGNCTKDLAEEFGGKHVPGCSPDHNEAIKILFDLETPEE
jgi:uncharacterized protein (DUF362 family)